MATKVTPDNQVIWQAYWHLKGEGQEALGMKPIPFTAIEKYARKWLREPCPVQRAFVVRAVIELDNVARDHAARKEGK